MTRGGDISYLVQRRYIGRSGGQVGRELLPVVIADLHTERGHVTAHDLASEQTQDARSTPLLLDGETVSATALTRPIDPIPTIPRRRPTCDLSAMEGESWSVESRVWDRSGCRWAHRPRVLFAIEFPPIVHSPRLRDRSAPVVPRRAARMRITCVGPSTNDRVSFRSRPLRGLSERKSTHAVSRGRLGDRVGRVGIVDVLGVEE